VNAGREAEGVLDMSFRCRAPTQIKLRNPDAPVCHGQIPIQRQCPLAFCDALSRAVRENFHEAHDVMS
jgi:hypothetical protein